MKSWQIAIFVLIGVITLAIAVRLGLGFGLKTDASPVREVNDNVVAPNKEERAASKKKPGDIASTGSECDTGFAELWNNKGSTEAKRCCPEDKVKSISGLSWCSSLVDASMCMYDEQCQSGYCSPGATSDSVCVPKATAGVAMTSSRGSSGCELGVAALWNDKSLLSHTRCCPTRSSRSFESSVWCTELPIASQCIYNWQCSSTYCSPGANANSMCAAAPHEQPAGMCMSGVNSGICNDVITNENCNVQVNSNNVEIYNKRENLIWQSNTRGIGKYLGKLIMQADGNLVVSTETGLLWRSDTAGKGTGPFVASVGTDCKLTVSDSTGLSTWSSA